MNIKCKCGRRVKSEYKFCPFCGAPAEEVTRKYSLYELLPVYTDGQLVDAVERLRDCDEITIRNALFGEKVVSPTVYVVNATYYDVSIAEDNKKYNTNRQPWRKANHAELNWLSRQDRKIVTTVFVYVAETQATPSTMAAYIGKTVFHKKSDAIKAARRIATEQVWELTKETKEEKESTE